MTPPPWTEVPALVNSWITDARTLAGVDGPELLDALAELHGSFRADPPLPRRQRTRGATGAQLTAGQARLPGRSLTASTSSSCQQSPAPPGSCRARDYRAVRQRAARRRNPRTAEGRQSSRRDLAQLTRMGRRVHRRPFTSAADATNGPAGALALSARCGLLTYDGRCLPSDKTRCAATTVEARVSPSGSATKQEFEIRTGAADNWSSDLIAAGR
jgi:hypothetical protein